MKNRKLLYIALALIGLSAGSCRQIDKLTIFDIDYSDKVVVESLIGINLPFNLITPAITTNSESSFEINDTRKDLIEEIHAKSIKLTLTLPESGDFKFLNSIKVYISADGLEEKLLAWKDTVPVDAGKTFNLDCSPEDFQDYIKKDEIFLRMNTVTDKLILTDQEIQIDAVFEVNAKILGI
jgi:hypothetical protein